MGGSSSRPNPGVKDLVDEMLNAMSKCNEMMKNSSAPLDENGNPLEIYCPAEWDNLACWPNSPPGPVSIICPEHISEFDQDAVARRYCRENGEWLFSDEANKTWVKYSQCHFALPSEDELAQSLMHGVPDIQRLVTLYTVGYSATLVSLTFATIILVYFPKLHCTRNYIHLHLFASFILRAIIIFVKDRVLFLGSGILDVSSTDPATLVLELQSQPNDLYTVGCKIVMTLFHYFVAANYYWILVEALHLHSLIFLTVFSEKKYLWKFVLIGWGTPVLFMVPWVVVRATLGDTKCWDTAIPQYKWIYNGPIVVANVINFLLFLNIIRVLWYKMREIGAISGMGDRKKYRKLAKSTLVLIFMFGAHAIIFLGMPDSVQDGWAWTIRMYFDLFFNSFQGFFVAIIYCFCNGEVQAEFKKAWDRFSLNVEMQRGNRDRGRSSVTGLTTFISSASHQTRFSIAGQGNRRGSNTHKNLCHTTNNNCTTSSANGNSPPEYTAPLLNQNGSQSSQASAADDLLLGLGEDEQLAAYATKSRESLSIAKIPSQHENDIEEKAFEMALEESNSDKKSSAIERNESNTGSRKSSSGAESDGHKCKRTPSFDSGISVMATGHPRLSRGFSSNSESPTKESYDGDVM